MQRLNIESAEYAASLTGSPNTSPTALTAGAIRPRALLPLWSTFWGPCGDFANRSYSVLSFRASCVSCSSRASFASSSLVKSSKASPILAFLHSLTVSVPVSVLECSVGCSMVWAPVKLVGGISGNRENTRTLLSLSQCNWRHTI